MFSVTKLLRVLGRRNELHVRRCAPGSGSISTVIARGDRLLAERERLSLHASFVCTPESICPGRIFAVSTAPAAVACSYAELLEFRFHRLSIARSKPESGDRSPLESLRSEFARKPFQQCFVVVHSSSAATHLICERRLSIAQSQGMCAAANGNLACVWASLCVYIDQ